jgi:hypothetical protein
MFTLRMYVLPMSGGFHANTPAVQCIYLLTQLLHPLPRDFCSDACGTCSLPMSWVNEGMSTDWSFFDTPTVQCISLNSGELEVVVV